MRPTSRRPLLAGKTCVVTGASRGIGRATAEGLAALGADLVLICRRREDGDAVIRELRRGARAEIVPADLSSQAAVRAAAAEIRSRHPRVHVLVNNAGRILRERQLTVDGLEMQFAVNHLAYFLLTNLLLDQLRAGAPARIVNVSSAAHAGARIDLNDLQSERGYSPGRVYARTKLANVLFTYELARRLRGSNVAVNCVHPGVIATRLMADYMNVPFMGGALARTFGGTPEQGAESVIYLAASPEVEGITGRYFSHRRETRSSATSYDEPLARQLWEVSARLTGLQPSAP